MQLKRLKLTNWRGIAEREVRFGDGITLIEGPNEAGKSTLIEALQLLLQEQHSSKKATVRAIQPAGQDTGSGVCAEFELGGAHFEYCKTFNRGAAAELKQLSGHSRQWTGREAHAHMTEQLEAHLDLTLWEALLVDQGAAVAQVTLSGSPSLAQALDSASGSSSDSETEQVSGTIFDAAQAAFEDHYTLKNRKPRFTEQQQAVADLEHALTDARDRLRALDDDLELEAREQRELAQLTAQRPALERNAARTAQQLETVRHFAEQKAALTRDLATVEQRLTEQQRLLDDRAARRARLAALQQKLSGTEKSLQQEQANRAPLTKRLAAARQHLEILRERRSERQRGLERAELEARLATIKEQQQNLEQDLLRRQRLHQEVRAVDERLAADPMTAQALEALRAAETELEISDQTLNLAATRYRLEAVAPLVVTIDGRERKLTAGETIEAPILTTHRLELEAVAELTLTAPAGLADARARRDAAFAALTDLRTRLGIPSLAEAVAAAEQRAAIASERTALARQLDALVADRTIDALTSQLDALQSEAREVERQLSTPARSSTATADSTVAAQRAALAEIDQSLKEQDALLVTLSEEDQQATTALRELEQQRIVEEATLAEQRRQIEAEEHRTSDADLSLRLEQLREELRKLQTQLETLQQQDSGLSIEDAAGLEQNARQALERADRRQQELRTALAVTRDRLERARADGRFELVQELEISLAASVEALSARERRARAARRLWETLNTHRDAARAAYLAPLKEQLERLGRLVFGADFAVNLSDDWQITHRTLRGRTLPFEALSVGAREQLSILLRLAAAQIVAPGGGIPLILDDTLGYADPERLTAMTNAIALAAERCQIIILTCDPGRYAQLGSAEVVRLER